jgi:hypothetical protein
MAMITQKSVCGQQGAQKKLRRRGKVDEKN